MNTSNLLESLRDKIEYAIDVEDSLLRRSVTHRSYANEKDLDYDNERLEFLGDAVLDLVIAEYLFHEHPDLSEGRLSKIKSSVVNSKSLSTVGREMGIQEYVRLSRGEEQANRGRDTVIADAVEAFIGALYVSDGIETTKKFILEYFMSEIERFLEEGSRNYKGMLLEFAQKQGLATPIYALESVEGPQHNPLHRVSVRIDETVYGSGEGRTKKEAEQSASEEALNKLQSEYPTQTS